MFEIESGKRKRNFSVCIFGPPGIGKTLMASSCSDKTLILDCEDGSSFLDVNRVRIESFESLLASLAWASKQDFDTIVLDSMTAVERLTHKHVLASNPKWTTLADGGYGKGYEEFRNNVQRIFAGIEHVKKTKNVIVLAHSKIKTVTEPGTDSFDRMEFDLEKNLIPIFVSQLDGCFYMRELTRVSKDEQGKNKPISSGARELVLNGRVGSLGKNRFDHMPATVEFAKTTKDTKTIYTQFWKDLQNVQNIPSSGNSAT